MDAEITSFGPELFYYVRGDGRRGGGGELVSPDAYRKSRCSLHEVNKYGRRGKERGRDEDREGNEGGE